ncbi:MAG: sensor histidine kinase [Clostridiales bacterium]|nr:sensor histidine kinase [Clostridiales bacterium]
MNELSLYILDIVQNSIAAGATRVAIGLRVEGETLILTVEDDGRGMAAELLARVKSPFATTRTTRPVGLGIPMLEQCAAATGGALGIDSAPGAGTRLWARFGLRHVDRPPLGDLPGTMVALVLGSPDGPDFTLTLNDAIALSTAEVRAALGEVPLTTPDVLEWIRQAISEALDGMNTDLSGIR